MFDNSCSVIEIDLNQFSCHIGDKTFLGEDDNDVFNKSFDNASTMDSDSGHSGSDLPPLLTGLSEEVISLETCVVFQNELAETSRRHSTPIASTSKQEVAQRVKTPGTIHRKVRNNNSICTLDISLSPIVPLSKRKRNQSPALCISKVFKYSQKRSSRITGDLSIQSHQKFTQTYRAIGTPGTSRDACWKFSSKQPPAKRHIPEELTFGDCDLDKPINTTHIQDKPTIASHILDEPATNGHIQDGHTTTSLSLDEPNTTSHIPDEPTTTTHVPDEPSTTTHILDEPDVTSHTCNKSVITRNILEQAIATSHCPYEASAKCKSPEQATGSRRIVAFHDIELTRLLGSGGFGYVYEGFLNGRQVAVKKMHAHTKNDKARLQSYLAEMSLWKLRHPNVVRMIAMGMRPRCLSDIVRGEIEHTDDARARFCSVPEDNQGSMIDGSFLVMEYVGERNLQQIINCPRESLPLTRRLRYAADITSGLAFIHSNRVIHLDLKPANILITPDDGCKLGDFGCSQEVEMGTGIAVPIPKSYVTGTFAYRAPELLRGELPSYKADIYSLGVTLWQMQAREIPYSGENQHVFIFGVVAYDLRPEIPKILLDGDPDEQCYRDLYAQCWDADMTKRPGASELADVIIGLLIQ